jgi:hypothetical protein
MSLWVIYDPDHDDVNYDITQNTTTTDDDSWMKVWVGPVARHLHAHLDLTARPVSNCLC